MRALADAVKSSVLPGCCVAILLDGNPGNAAVVAAALQARNWHPPPPRSIKDTASSPVPRKIKTVEAGGTNGSVARSGHGRAMGSTNSPGSAGASPGGPAERGAALINGTRMSIKPGLPRGTSPDSTAPLTPKRSLVAQRTPERGGALANFYEGDWSGAQQQGTQEGARLD